MQEDGQTEKKPYEVEPKLTINCAIYDTDENLSKYESIMRSDEDSVFMVHRGGDEMEGVLGVFRPNVVMVGSEWVDKAMETEEEKTSFMEKQLKKFGAVGIICSSVEGLAKEFSKYKDNENVIFIKGKEVDLSGLSEGDEMIGRVQDIGSGARILNEKVLSKRKSTTFAASRDWNRKRG